MSFYYKCNGKKNVRGMTLAYTGAITYLHPRPEILIIQGHFSLGI